MITFDRLTFRLRIWFYSIFAKMKYNINCRFWFCMAWYYRQFMIFEILLLLLLKWSTLVVKYTQWVSEWMLQLVNAVCVCDVLFCLSFSGFVGHLMFVNFNLFLSFRSEIFYLFWYFYCNDFSYYCQHIYGLMIYRVDFFLFIYFEWKSFFPEGQWQIFFVSSDLNSIDWLPWNQ